VFLQFLQFVSGVHMIYFVQTDDNRFIKVGKANDPRQRLASLQTGSPVRLKLIGAIPGGHETEHAIHQRFQALRTYGEWFRASDDLLDYITQVLAAQRSDPFSAFDALALYEPRLLDLYREIIGIQDDGEASWFCANAVWYGHEGWPGIKPRLMCLVGWEAEKWGVARLRTTEAYDLAYDTLYTLLPDCRSCRCA
jgi:hypothetical protein